VVPGPAPEGGQRVGGIDWGFRNPFAAVWGVLDRDGVLWLTGEHYEANKVLSYHAQHLPRKVMWYCDPSEPGQLAALAYADFKLRKGNNQVRLGITAVSARLEAGTLRVLAGACPNLLWEAEMYRYSTEPAAAQAEEPHREDNHALDALRYLVASLDAYRLAKRPAVPPAAPAAPAGGAAAGPESGAPPAPKGDPPPSETGWKKPKDAWLSVRNEALWTRLW
jgi:hypothetical protein